MELNPATQSLYKPIRALYRAAFPWQERIPFWLLRRKARQSNVEILAIQENGAFLGLAIVLLQGRFSFLNYFAISPEMRGRGVGRQTLLLLRQRYPQHTLLLEIEAPDASASNSAQRASRRAFYLRNGLLSTGVNILLSGVKMELLADHIPVTFPEYYDVYRRTFGNIITRMIRLRLLSANPPYCNNSQNQL